MGLKAGLGGHHVFDPSGGVTSAVLLSLEDAEALWSLDGDLLDQGTNGFDFNPTPVAGTKRFVRGPAPGTQALWCDGATRFRSLAQGSALSPLAVNNQTTEVVCRPSARPASGVSATFFHMLDDPSGTPVGTGVRAFDLRYKHDVATTTIGPFVGWLSTSFEFIEPKAGQPTWDQWLHMALVRDVTNSIGKLLVNGILLATRVATTIDVTSLTDDRIQLGGSSSAGGEFYTGGISSIRVTNRAKTEAELLAAAKLSVPGHFLGQI